MVGTLLLLHAVVEWQSTSRRTLRRRMHGDNSTHGSHLKHTPRRATIEGQLPGGTQRRCRRESCTPIPTPIRVVTGENAANSPLRMDRSIALRESASETRGQIAAVHSLS